MRNLTLDRNTQRRLAYAETVKGMAQPIVIRDESGERIVDAATLPAHLRRYYGATTVKRTRRARPHRNMQGIKGGMRGNGAMHDGKVHGLTPTGKV